MEYYLAIKNNDLMNFLDKWMELENIILSEVTQSQKNTWYALTDKWISATYQWVHTIYLILWLGYLSQDDIL